MRLFKGQHVILSNEFNAEIKGRVIILSDNQSAVGISFDDIEGVRTKNGGLLIGGFLALNHEEDRFEDFDGTEWIVREDKH